MSDDLERNALRDILTASIKEQRTARRWGIFFKLLTFSWLFMLMLVLFGLMRAGDSENGATEPHVAVVKLEGVIAPGEDTEGLLMLDGLRTAFKNPQTRAVIIRANSPGGSPVQSGILYDEIMRLRKLHPAVPLYVVIEDVCASGCYYVAAAANAIYADKASIVGSIGVLMNGFGFTGAMDKLGVERRLLTAGSNKGMLDPFSPMSPEQKDKAQVMLDEIHQQFIAAVKAGRGNKLANDPDLFSGLFWSGARAKQLGLVDNLGSVVSVARDVIKIEKLVDFTPHDSLPERLAKQMGVSMANKLGTSLMTQKVQ